MENVFASLNKKDSLRVLLEHYEQSLHKADGISDSPRDNGLEKLIGKSSAEEDNFSKILKEK